MAPNVRSSKITLACPLFAAEFDPRNNEYLLVAGGGGEGRSGVGNKIYLLDTSSREGLSEVVNVDLSPNEDSVSSLGVAQSNDDSVIAFAGINSSQAEQQENRNEHLRSFKLDYPPRKSLANGNEEDNKRAKGKKGKNKKREAKSPALSRVSLFRPEKSAKGKERELYQRILRVSPWRGEGYPRIAAIATGFAPQGEIILFNANTSTPQQSDVLSRINVGEKLEAEDLDIIPTDEEGHFKLGYTDGSSLYISKTSTSTRPASVKPHCVYTATASKKTRFKIRALRFITQNYIALVQNTTDRTGCELVLLSKHGNSSHAVVVRKRRLPSSAKVGLGLDVSTLPASPTGEKQVVLAVSSGDHSIHVFTVDYSATNGFGKFQPFTTIRDVHPFSMTRISFSTFTPPAHPVAADVPPQYLKLASVSVGNTAVVHTLPLSPYPAKSLTPRYVLVRPGPSEFLQTIFSGFVALVVVVLGAFFLQAFTEIRGGVPPTLGAVDWLSPRLREMVARPYMFENGRPVPTASYTDAVTSTSDETGIPTVRTTEPEFLRELIYVNMLREASGDGQDTSPVIMVEDHGRGKISARTSGVGGADDTNDIPASATTWQDLSIEEREIWRWKLIVAGHLAEEDDTHALYGVYFGALADE